MAAQAMKERILDAVEQCLEQYGLEKTTLQQVANHAGVSRMTLYRHFKHRQALLDGAMLRNIKRHWRFVAARLGKITRLDEWLLEALVIYQLELCHDPSIDLYRKINAYDMGFIVSLTKPGLTAVSVHFQELFDAIATDGCLSNNLDKDDIAEWVHRFNLSLLRNPSPRLQQEDQLRYWIRAQLCSGIVPSS
jgi:AcrR family transcriptional regulator